MKILFASSFYTEFELYSTENPDDLKRTLKTLYDGGKAEIDPEKHVLIGSQDDMEASGAIAQADEIIYTDEL